MYHLLDGLKAPSVKLLNQRMERQLWMFSKAELKAALRDDTVYRLRPLRNRIYAELIRRIRLGIR